MSVLSTVILFKQQNSVIMFRYSSTQFSIYWPWKDIITWIIYNLVTTSFMRSVKTI